MEVKKEKINIKKIIAILILFFTVSVVAQKREATLFFRDGATLNGLAEISTDRKEISFKKNNESSEEIFNSRKVSKLKIRKNKSDIIYYYKIIDTKNILLLKRIVNGKTSLYMDTQNTFSPGIRMNTGLGHWTTVGGGKPITIITYYLAKGDSDIVISSKDIDKFGFPFRYAASKYFNDCNELVSKIKKRKFKKNDMKKIVLFYNSNCE